METMEEAILKTPYEEMRAMWLCIGAAQRGDVEAERAHRAAYRREKAKRVIDTTGHELDGGITDHLRDTRDSEIPPDSSR